MVISGLIVGFDADGPDIFERQRRFVESAPIPIFSLGALVASSGSPLHERMARNGRLLAEQPYGTAQPWSSNIIPLQMTADSLLEGLRRLGNHIYSPQAFGDRMVAMLDRLGATPSASLPVSTMLSVPKHREALKSETAAIIKQLALSGAAEKAMVARVGRHALQNCPQALPLVQTCLRFYAQIRHVYRLTGFEPA